MFFFNNIASPKFTRDTSCRQLTCQLIVVAFPYQSLTNHNRSPTTGGLFKRAAALTTLLGLSLKWP